MIAALAITHVAVGLAPFVVGAALFVLWKAWEERE